MSNTRNIQKVASSRSRLCRGVFRHFAPVWAVGTPFSMVLGVLLSLSIGCPANAGDILRGGASMSSSGGSASHGSNPAAVEQARANAKDALSRTTQAVQAVRAMQDAARKVAIGRNNLGLDPNHPGQQLPNVPNGLGLGGLQIAPGVPVDLAHPVSGEDASLWQGAKLPTQTVAGGKTEVTIKQTARQALLTWETFNIGKETTLTFDQSSGGKSTSDWIAFNKINDPSGRPSQILGKMNAQGQVYVINPNGIIFGGASQINLHTLVAASLPINDNLLSQGLLNNRDSQFLFSAFNVPGGADGTPSFLPSLPSTPDGHYGDVVVQSGAQLQSPLSSSAKGGRIMLAGANVNNEGTISTPSGQTILAAGLQVAVTAHASNDPSLRGLDVWVGAVGDYAGTVTNSGMIDALTGSILMAGRRVNQLGSIESSTSVSLNGRVDLRASYGAVTNPNFDNVGQEGYGFAPFVFQNTGVVTLGEGSSTRILPDYSSGETAPGRSLPEASQINMEGLAIHFARDAMVLAPNADVTLRAGVWPYQDADGNRTTFDAAGAPEPGLSSLFSEATQRFLYSNGQIYLDKDSLINVAGSADVYVPLAQSLLTVQMRGSELADSPLQRGGVIAGVPLTVDIRRTGEMDGRFWMGTPLGDATGFAGLIQRNAAQLTAAGGSVVIQAGNSIVIQDAAKIDVSGGFYNYEGGMVNTSRLFQQGRLVNIADALPGQLYDGIYTGKFATTHAKWGISETFSSPLSSGEHYEAGYVGGADGGSLTLTAPSMALDGDLIGLSINGERQRAVSPELSSLSLAFRSEKSFQASANSPLKFLAISLTPPEVIFQSETHLAAAAPFELVADEPVALRADRLASVILSPELLDKNGFGNLSVENTEGNILLPGGTKLRTPAFGSISLIGANVIIRDDITAPGGDLSFTAYNISPAAVVDLPLLNTNGYLVPIPNADRGLFTLGAGAKLSTAGLIIDDRLQREASLSTPLVINGGNITVSSYNAELAVGSTIDVAGGARVDTRGRVSYGNGGKIALLAGKDPGLSPVFGSGVSGVVGGKLSLGSTLLGYSGATGGSLLLQSSLIQIGGVVNQANTLLLSPDFFTQGGFTSYALTGIGAASDSFGDDTYIPGISITAGTRIEPVAESWLALTNLRDSEQVTLSPILKPMALRSPVSLSFAVLGADDPFTLQDIEIRGDLFMGTGSSIVTGPRGRVSFKGQTVTLLGSVSAPAGSISIAGDGKFPLGLSATENAAEARSTVFIGSHANLSTAGTTVLNPDLYGRHIGSVYDGGTISISGNIVASAGAVMDVSGASSLLDLYPSVLGQPGVPLNSGLNSPLWSLQTVPTRMDSSGGDIKLVGSQMLFSDATLLGAAGGSTGLGGSLSVFAGRYYPANAAVRTGADINLVVTQNGLTIPSTNHDLGVGLPVLNEAGTAFTGMGYFSVNRFVKGRFDSLDLGADYLETASPVPYGGNVEFKGPVTISARGFLRVAGGGIIQADSPVRFDAPYVAIGQPFRAPINPDDPVNFPFQQYPGTPSPGYPISPTFGPGSVKIQAQVIDVGTVSLQNIGSATLIANGGDIRGNGTFGIAGDLKLQAGQIYPTTLSAFNLFAYDHGGTQGSITIIGSGKRTPPLSAGGALGIYASNISQGGVLRAPVGSITLGWDGTDLDPSDADLDRPLDPVSGSGASVPVTKKLELKSGSITSVAAVLPSGSPMLIPFGLSPDGTSWIDPSGENVTTTGLPTKQVSISADSVITEAGSVVDIRGGGDLYAFRWVSGPGGSADLLGTATDAWASGKGYQAGALVSYKGETWSARVSNSGNTPSVSLYWSRVPESYAILPGFGSELAPYAPFNTGVKAGALAGNPGYVSNTLSLGDRIYLEGSPGLAAGEYTLLPRRYALLPGAYLVTPRTTAPMGTVAVADGSSYVSGYTFNQYDQAQNTSTLRSQFEVAPYDVVRNRATYNDYTANAFLKNAAKSLDVSHPQRLPMDGGYLTFHGSTVLQLANSVLANGPVGGRAASVDLSSFSDIFIIGGDGVAPVGATAVLDAGLLSKWNAGSLLIGGIRRDTPEGQVLEVRSNNVTLDNPGSSLTGPEFILAASEKLSITAGSSIESIGPLSSNSEPLAVVGDGALLRVSSDPGATISRSGLAGSTLPLLSIGAGSVIGGQSVILDSTYGTSIASSAVIRASTLTLGSGQISIVLAEPPAGLVGSTVNQHLVLAGQFLADAQAVDTLHLTSYSSIDFYGAGSFGTSSLDLTLQGGGIRGFAQAGGVVSISSHDVLLNNPGNLAAPVAPVEVSGNLELSSQTIRLGAHSFSVAGYENLVLNASTAVLGQGNGGLTSAGNITIRTPLITANQGSKQAITAGGALVMESSGGSVATNLSGLGASFKFTGASILENTSILMPSGEIVLHATTGDVVVGGELNAAGFAKQFFDLTRYSDAGHIKLESTRGNVATLAGGKISVAAAAAGGNAGTFEVSTPVGDYTAGATLFGGAGVNGKSGKFILDVKSVPSYAALSAPLDAGGFFESRSIRVRIGDVMIDGNTRARDFSLSADAGAITVTGVINASGKTGGNISLAARDSLVLTPTAELNVHAKEFSSAGKGGEVRLEAGASINGVSNLAAVVDIQGDASGRSKIDLGVDEFVAGNYSTPGSSAFYGEFTGKLQLRAPRNGNDVNVNSIGGNILGASSVLVEGYRVYDRTGLGTLDNTLKSTINTDAANYMNAGYAAMRDKLLLGNLDSVGLGSALVIAPGVEIINRTGDLTLGTSADNSANDWNLATFRYGPNAAAGVLTLRAAGNLVFNNALSDGFSGGVPSGTPTGQQLWLSRLMAVNDALPVNTQSWSYNLTAGADLGAADFHQVQSLAKLGDATETILDDVGSLLLGKFYAANLVSGPNATTAAAINNRFQVIRTGAGDIDIAAGRDVQLRNQFATIYTAGVRLPTPTTIFTTDDFVRPLVEQSARHPGQDNLGAPQQVYPSQWSMAGGNLSINANGDIGRFTMYNGSTVADTSRQLPTNWLYRRGYVDPATGLFAANGGVDAGLSSVTDPSASTTWWVDFSNFFQGFGALGGGDVALHAGHDLINADAVIPTNARMPGRVQNADLTFTNLAPDSSKLVELGGGDLDIRANNNIDGGTYYVERGRGTLFAGGAITTNAARSPSLGILGSTGLSSSIVQSQTPAVYDPLTWMPTMLFVGKSSFDISARGDILLGPATNPFFLPQGVNNKFWYKTYFDTFSPEASISVASFGGSVTHRFAVTLPGQSSATSILPAWIANQNAYGGSVGNASNFQPWIRLAELDTKYFDNMLELFAPSLLSTAFAGNINLVGNTTLFPSTKGSLELAASGGIVGLNPSGKSNVAGQDVQVWTSASVNLSDANPASVPGVASPLAYQSLVGRALIASRESRKNSFGSIDNLFDETGSYTGEAGTIDVQQALHAATPLHTGDTGPVRLYAGGGDITGLTLYSPKATRLLASNDITDVAFYLQNIGDGDVSVVSAGRDIIPYNENAALRSLAGDLTKGNLVGDTDRKTVTGINTNVLPGDIQINGPGVLEVFAGRNLDLGTGPNLADGTGVGIVSIGNARNPFLAAEGANIVVGAGLGFANGLSGSKLDFESFIAQYLSAGGTGGYLIELGLTQEEFDAMAPEKRDFVAMQAFYLLLRDAGREQGILSTGGAGTIAGSSGYQKGLDAISVLFPESNQGDIFTRARDIRTSAGGSILMAAPGGGIAMASDIFGNPLTPPGIVTEAGGSVTIFTDASVDIGRARIFTLRGGDIIIWSSNGNIAAGTAPKTVVTAPPTRVVIDTNSADVETDLGGLATGGGIGVLASMAGVLPGNVDLIAPSGQVDAGDAGIRVTGNLNIAADSVLNASNINAGGSSTGVPAAPVVAPPNLAGLAAASSTAGAQNGSADEAAKQQARNQQPQQEEAPSIITVEVIGYGGGDDAA